MCSFSPHYALYFLIHFIPYIWTVQDMSLAAKEAMLGQLDMLKAKYDEAVDARKKTEHDIENLRPVRNSGKSCKNSKLYVNRRLANRIDFYFICGSMPQDVDRATSARIALEKQLEHLEVQLAFLQRVHKEVMHVCLSTRLSIYSIL